MSFFRARGHCGLGDDDCGSRCHDSWPAATGISIADRLTRLPPPSAAPRPAFDRYGAPAGICTHRRSFAPFPEGTANSLGELPPSPFLPSVRDQRPEVSARETVQDFGCEPSDHARGVCCRRIREVSEGIVFRREHVLPCLDEDRPGVKPSLVACCLVFNDSRLQFQPEG